MSVKTILAICGSTRAQSTNLHLINAIRSIFAHRLNVQVFTSLAELPQFNPDEDHENPPSFIILFRQLLRSVDGILICTPEYAMGVPGSLKNAIDWTVSSCEFSHKPTALITASSMGQTGHESMLATLKIIEANITDDTQLLIPYAKTKIKSDGISDEVTARQVTHLIHSFIDILD